MTGKIGWIGRVMLFVIVLLSSQDLYARVGWAAEGNVGVGVLPGLPGHSASLTACRIGPVAIIPVKGWLSLRPGLMWSHKGGVLEGYYGGEQITGARMPVSLDFIEVPVLLAVRFPVAKRLGLTLKTGPYVGVGISGKTCVKPDGGGRISMPGNLFSSGCDYYGNAQTSNKKDFALPKLNRWDAGLTWGIELEFCEHYAVGGNLSWGFARLSPKGLADNVGEAFAQVIFMQDRMRPFTAMLSFSYIF